MIVFSTFSLFVPVIMANNKVMIGLLKTRSAKHFFSLALNVIHASRLFIGFLFNSESKKAHAIWR